MVRLLKGSVEGIVMRYSKSESQREKRNNSLIAEDFVRGAREGRREGATEAFRGTFRR